MAVVRYGGNPFVKHLRKCRGQNAERHTDVTDGRSHQSDLFVAENRKHELGKNTKCRGDHHAWHDEQGIVAVAFPAQDVLARSQPQHLAVVPQKQPDVEHAKGPFLPQHAAGS